MPLESYLDLSDLFRSDRIRAAFSLRSFHHKRPDDRGGLSALVGLNPNHVVKPKQVHSADVKFVYTSGKIAATDALISNSNSIVLSIQVADCIPLFLADPLNGVIGLVHAGWRGVEKRIIPDTVNKMVQKGGIRKGIIAFMGPSIRQCCFEIGPEVSKKFPIDCLINGNRDRSFLDLQRVAINQLLGSQVLEKNILSSEECTKCNPDKYFSYRRSGSKAGRMIGVIGLT
jgi:YfiH family protein